MFILIFLVAVLLFLYNSSKDVVAAPFTPPNTGDNVSGFAWNDNVKWISFNASNCDSDSDGISDNVDFAQCPVGEPIVDYGVKIDLNTGDFFGHAWNDNVGWISFDRVDVGVGNPPEAPYNGGVGAIARYDFVSFQVSGWAKIVSLGDDGWIKFRDVNWVNGVHADPSTSEIGGWAYNEGDDSVGIGWISFDSDNPSSSGGSYQVMAEINQAPTAINLTAPNWIYSCSPESIEGGFGEVRGGWLNWVFSDPDVGDAEEFYRVVLFDKTDGVEVFDTGKCKGFGFLEGDIPESYCRTGVGVGHYTLGYVAGNSTELIEGHSYEWQVELWDDKGASSGLVSFDQSIAGHQLVDGEDDGDDFTFTIYQNQFPIPYFSWLPEKPSKESPVAFFDVSTFFDGEAEHDSTDWEFSNGNTPQDASTTYQVFIMDNFYATSTVVDINAYSCSTSTAFQVPVNYRLPRWMESR